MKSMKGTGLMDRQEKVARAIAARKMGIEDGGVNLPDDLWQKSIPDADTAIEIMRRRDDFAKLPKVEMKDDMVERLARALHDLDPAYSWPWEEYSHSPEYHEDRRNQARAVIKAMREPTEGMGNAGGKEYQHLEEHPRVWINDNAIHIWQAMIDAA